MPVMTRRLLAPTSLVFASAVICRCGSTAPTPASTTKPALLHLTFTGAVAATGRSVTSANAQCVQAPSGPSDGWAVNATITTPGNQWNFSLDYTAGTAKPGRFQLNSGQAGVAASTPMILEMESTNPIADYLTSADATSYTYYMPDTLGNATVNASLESGSLDATFTPSTPSNLTFTVKGTWSCG